MATLCCLARGALLVGVYARVSGTNKARVCYAHDVWGRNAACRGDYKRVIANGWVRAVAFEGGSQTIGSEMLHFKGDRK